MWDNFEKVKFAVYQVGNRFLSVGDDEESAIDGAIKMTGNPDIQDEMDEYLECVCQKMGMC